MKRTIATTIIIAACAVSAFAQPQQAVIKEKSTQILNKQQTSLSLLKKRMILTPMNIQSDLLQEKVYSVPTESAIIPEMKTRYNWEDGKPVSRIHLKYENDLWIEEARERFEYQNGYLTQETHEIADFGIWHPISKIEYQYGFHHLNGSLINVDELIWEVLNSQWTLIERHRTFLDEEGTSIGGIHHSYVDGQWLPVSQWELEHNEQNETVITHQEWVEMEGYEGFWLSTERTVFNNINPKELESTLKEIMADFTETLGENAFYKLPAHTIYISYYDEWEPVSRVQRSNEYSWLNGMYSKSIVTLENYLMDGWEPEKRYRITFNDFGKEESINIDFWFDEWFHFNRNLFQYSEQGKLIHIEERINVFGQFYHVGTVQFQWSETPTSIEPVHAPVQFELGYAYPNPFNPSTSIPFELNQGTQLKLTVFDMLGRRVTELVNGFYPSGMHTVQFNAAGLSSGMYLVRLEAGGLSKTQKISLLK